MVSERAFGIDFLILGAQKAGTTALAHFLGEHPGICMAREKEVHLFDYVESPGLDWTPGGITRRYRESFPDFAGEGLVGEATPEYLFLPWVPNLLYAFHPELRLIVLLREPGARAMSHYQHELSGGAARWPFLMEILLERFRTLAAPASCDPSRYRPPMLRRAFVERGRYAGQLRSYLEYFPRSRILILLSENLRCDHGFALESVLAFLGTESAADLPPTSTHNPSAPASRATRWTACWLSRVLRTEVEELGCSMSLDLTPWGVRSEAQPRPATTSKSGHASALEEERPPRERENNLSPSLYALGDLDGDGRRWRALARHLPSSLALVGLEPPRGGWTSRGVESLPDIVSYHLRSLPTTGSLGLAAVGFGCLVAAELARRLRERGQDVRFLVFVEPADPDHPCSHLPEGDWGAGLHGRDEEVVRWTREHRAIAVRSQRVEPVTEEIHLFLAGLRSPAPLIDTRLRWLDRAAAGVRILRLPCARERLLGPDQLPIRISECLAELDATKRLRGAGSIEDYSEQFRMHYDEAEATLLLPSGTLLQVLDAPGGRLEKVVHENESWMRIEGWVPVDCDGQRPEALAVLLDWSLAALQRLRSEPHDSGARRRFSVSLRSPLSSCRLRVFALLPGNRVLPLRGDDPRGFTISQR